MTLLEFLVRLGLALVCGALVGAERQWRQRMAGLRTNALVAAGSALFTCIGGLIAHGDSEQRIVAQVVSGIGFLGAGVIMREGLNVRGLNTAATLWCTAGVGILAGLGFYLEAVMAAGAIVIANVFLRPLAGRINRQPLDSTELETYYNLRVSCRRREESRVRVLLLNIVNSEPMTLRALRSVAGEGQNSVEVTATIAVPGRGTAALERIVSRLSLEGGVHAISWEISNGRDPVDEGSGEADRAGFFPEPLMAETVSD